MNPCFVNSPESRRVHEAVILTEKKCHFKKEKENFFSLRHVQRYKPIYSVDCALENPDSNFPFVCSDGHYVKIKPGGNKHKVRQ